MGANFAYKFLELGSKVHILEKSEVNLWRINKIRNKINIHYLDLTNRTETEEAVSKIKPDIVLHFAAYGAYQRFQQDIGLTINANLKGTINLVNACGKTGVECFINTGTSSEYGIKQKPMKETDILQADNLYGITKAAATMYCQMAARRFNFPAVIIRLSAVYGYYEEPGRLMPDVIKPCLANTKLKLSDPKSVRDFIFIEDVINAYLSAIKNIKKIKGEIFNIGAGKQHSVSEVVAIVKKITGSKIKPVYGAIKKVQAEPKNWLVDILKAKKMLGWEPEHSLEEGLKKNIEWFKKNLYFYKN